MTVFSKPETGNGTTVRRRLIPPIPLERPAKKDLQHGEYQTYKLCNNPSEENSLVYKLLVPYFVLEPVRNGYFLGVTLTR